MRFPDIFLNPSDSFAPLFFFNIFGLCSNKNSLAINSKHFPSPNNQYYKKAVFPDSIPNKFLKYDRTTDHILTLKAVVNIYVVDQKGKKTNTGQHVPKMLMSVLDKKNRGCHKIHLEIELYKLILFNNRKVKTCPFLTHCALGDHINLQLEINFSRQLRVGGDSKLVTFT